MMHGMTTAKEIYVPVSNASQLEEALVRMKGWPAEHVQRVLESARALFAICDILGVDPATRRTMGLHLLKNITP